MGQTGELGEKGERGKRGPKGPLGPKGNYVSTNVFFRQRAKSSITSFDDGSGI